MFPKTYDSRKSHTESLVKRPESNVYQNIQVNPKFQDFEQKFNALKGIVLNDPSQISDIEELIKEVYMSIRSSNNNIKLPDDFVNESQIVEFCQDLINTFSGNPPIYTKSWILLLYVLNSSKQAVFNYIQSGPQQKIIELFHSDNLKETQICYEILVRFNDTNCKDIESNQFCQDLGLYPEIFERTNFILDNKLLNDQAHHDNMLALLKVIYSMTNALSLKQIASYEEVLFEIFGKVLTYDDDEVRISFAKYAIYSLFFLSKDPLYKDIIESGLFRASMDFIEYEETASFTTLLSIQMLQTSSEDNEYLEMVKPLLPLTKSHYYFLETKDPQLLRYILTLFTNSICFDLSLGPEGELKLTELLSSESDLERLNELIESDTQDIQYRAIWCIWNMLRFGEFDVLTNILNYGN